MSDKRCVVVYSKQRFGSVMRSDVMSYDDALVLAEKLRSKGWPTVRIDIKSAVRNG